MRVCEGSTKAVCTLIEKLDRCWDLDGHRCDLIQLQKLQKTIVGHQQDVGKQDRRIEAEAPNRLQCHLGRERELNIEIEDWRTGRLFRDKRSGR